MNKLSPICIATTLCTIIILGFEAELAIAGQPITAIILLLPLALLRPFAFRNPPKWWTLRFDPVLPVSIFLISALAHGMGTGSPFGDTIARISFWVLAVTTFIFMMIIDLYQWKRRT